MAVPIAVQAAGSSNQKPENQADQAARAAEVPAKSSSVKQIVFEEQKIEGKIRRPQLVLIKADQRPEFSPMIMQSIGKTKNIASLVDPDVVEFTPDKGAFLLEGTRIMNIVP